MALQVTEWDFGLKLHIKLLSYPNGVLAKKAQLVFEDDEMVGRIEIMRERQNVVGGEAQMVGEVEDDLEAYYILKGREDALYHIPHILFSLNSISPTSTDPRGAQVELSFLSRPHVEMDVAKKNESSTKRLKSHVVRLAVVPTIVARMSRTKRNTVVVDWDQSEDIACIRRIKVYERVETNGFLAYIKNSQPTDHLIASVNDVVKEKDGRFVLSDDIEVRALTNKQFMVEAYLPDGRRTEKVRLEPAPEQLLKAVIEDFGRTLAVELVGEEDSFSDHESECFSFNSCIPARTTLETDNCAFVCFDFFGLVRRSGSGSIPQFESVDDFSNSPNRDHFDETKLTSIRLPQCIQLVQHNGYGGKSITKINRDPEKPGKYRLVDRNNLQIPFSSTRNCFVEAKLTDGITYASSDAIEVSPLPEAPRVEVMTHLRNPRSPHLSITALDSGDMWVHIANVELRYDAEFWSRKNTKIVLQMDKKTIQYSAAQRKFKIPLEVNLHGIDFELIFLLADGREWFRRSELKPLTIEKDLEGLINLLKMLNILKDTDLFYWRRLLLILHRYQIVLYIILGLFALQIVLSLPLVGSIITSIMWKIKLLLVKLISMFISFITSTLPRFGLGVLPLLEKVCVAIQQLIIPSNE